MTLRTSCFLFTAGVAALLAACAGPPAPGDVAAVDSLPPDTVGYAEALPPPLTAEAQAAALTTSNEPAGFRPLLILPLTTTSGNGSGPVTVAKWQQMRIVQDASRGAVVECSYPLTMRGGNPACVVEGTNGTIRAQGVTRVYGRVWLQPSATFQGNRSSVNKIGFVGFGATGNQFILDMAGIGYGPLRGRIAVQSVSNLPPGVTPGLKGWNGASCSGSTTATSGNCSWSKPASGPAIARGQWSLLEYLLVNGPVGTRTSSATLWVNGQPAGTITGFDWNVPAINGTDLRASKLTLSLYWGGGPDQVLAPFSIRLSDFATSGAP